MNIRTFFLGMIAFLSTSTAFAQTEFNISQVTAINTGDGRLLFREREDEKTLTGQFRLIDGYKTEYILADFTDGFYNGSYEFFKYNKLNEKGSYKEGRKDGKWIKYFSDGQTIESETYLKEGKLDGICKTYFTDGKIESEKGYKNGLEHGKELRYDYETGKLKVDANFVDGKAEGKQTRYIQSNKGEYIQVSNYKNGNQTGEYTETYIKGKPKKKGFYKEGKKDGIWIEYRKDGIPENEVNYKGGRKNGKTTVYYTNGSVEKIIHYVDDAKEGVSQEFDYNSGKLKSEYNFSDNKKEGNYKLFYDDGTLREEGRCVDGDIVYRKEYYKSGQLKEIREYTGNGWETIESYDSDGKQK